MYTNHLLQLLASAVRNFNAYISIQRSILDVMSS